MIDLKRYSRLHPKGLCWIKRINENEFVVLFKRFNNETGEELEQHEPQYATLKALEDQQKELITLLETLNSIIEDIKTL